MKENENIKDTDLDLDALSEVNGGMCRRLGLRDDHLSEVGGGLALNLGSTLAYCKACGKKLKDLVIYIVLHYLLPEYLYNTYF